MLFQGRMDDQVQRDVDEGKAQYAEEGLGCDLGEKEVWTCTGKLNLQVHDILNQGFFSLPK